MGKGKKLNKYDEHKNNMKTGDLLLWQANPSSGWGFLKWIFRLITRSEYDHVSMVLRLQEFDKLQRVITESRCHGTVLNRLSYRLQKHNGKVWWYPLEDGWYPYGQKIGEALIERIGIPYDFVGLAKMILRRLFGEKCRKVFTRRGLRKIVTWMDKLEEKAVFCSEYCYWVYKSTGNLQCSLTALPSPDEIIDKLKIFKTRVQIL